MSFIVVQKAKKEFTITQILKQEYRFIYGALYNWYAVNDPRLICSAGWHVPTFANMLTYVSDMGYNWVESGQHLKETGLVNWESPNTGADNIVGFNARGSGLRSYDGTFYFAKRRFQFWYSDTIPPFGPGGMLQLVYDGIGMGGSINGTKIGCSVRPVKDVTALTHGQVGSYVDPSGITYPTICIGTQEFVSCNILTQHYRNGDDIPEVADHILWSALATGAMSVYDNNWDNAWVYEDIGKKVFTIYKVLQCGIIDDEMKYLSTVNLGAGVVTDITTTLTSEPYNIFVLDSAGNELGDPEIDVSLALVGGVYHVYIYTVDALNNVKVKILY